MSIPSVKTLMRIPELSLDSAKKIRALLQKNTSAVSALKACDKLMPESYGVEFIPEGHNAKSPEIIYINIGDPYSTTIMYVRDTYRVGCWGDIVERGNYD